MATEISKKPAPKVLEAPLNITLSECSLADLNAYRQAMYAMEWPPEGLTVPKRLAHHQMHRKLALEAAQGLALFLSDQASRSRVEQREPSMEIQAKQFVTTANERVLTDDGQQGMRGAPGVGSKTERHQGQVAAAIFANCAHLDNLQLDEIIEWIRLYKK